MSDADDLYAAPATSRVRAITDVALWRDASYAAVEYGPDIPSESELKLLGPVEGKRVLVLGCYGPAALALARQGAKVVGVGDADAITLTRHLAEQEELRVEVHESGLAELAFVRPDSFDIAISIYALGAVADVSRVFRQVHRVLKADAPLVVSVPHPAYLHAEHDQHPPRWARSYFDRDPLGAEGGYDHPRSAADLFLALVRANFRIDAFLEPAPRQDRSRSPHWTESMAWIPSTAILRARKEA